MTALWGAVAALATSAAAIYAALSRPGARLERLRIEVDILDTLEDGPARTDVQLLVDAHARELADRLHVARYWPGILGGGLIYVVAASVGLGAIRTGDFWLVAASLPFFLTAGVALYAAFRSWSRVPRDRDGFRLKPDAEQPDPPVT